jgi:hypothetical protein
MTPPILDTVHFGDCRATMRDLISHGVKVQTCVTSPPYFGLRDYGHAGQLGLEPTPAAYVENMVDVFRLVRDLLADDGVLWLNLGDSYASKGGPTPPMSGDIFAGRTRAEQTVCMSNRLGMGNGIKPKDLIGIPWRVAFALQADGWYLRQDIIWHKPNPMPESVTDRCTKAHEYLFLLSKRERYYWDAAAMREEAAPASLGRWAQDVDNQRGSDRVPGKTNGTMKAVGGPRRKTTSPSPSHVPAPPTFQPNRNTPDCIALEANGSHYSETAAASGPSLPCPTAAPTSPLSRRPSSSDPSWPAPAPATSCWTLFSAAAPRARWPTDWAATGSAARSIPPMRPCNGPGPHRPA